MMFAKSFRAQLRGIISAILLLSFLLSGCGQTPAKVEPTTTATTAPTNTSAPKPTDTPIPTSTSTQTPAPTATATVDIAATAAANKTATAVALDEIVKPDLVDLGINPEDGHLAFISKDDIKLEATSYNEEKKYPLDKLGKVGDFVLKTRVAWNSTGGIAGCGITFRAEDDLTNGAHYSLLLMRLQFMPYWDIEYHKFNRWQATITLTGKAMSTNKLNDDKNSSNVIALVVRGKEYTPYFNGEAQRPASHDKLTDGNIVLMSWQDSGKTTCKYTGTWVWVFDK
jgi:hypothetical protein